MERPHLPPTSTSISIDKPDDPSSTWHRPTNSLPHDLPSPLTSHVTSPPPPLHRQHSLNLFPTLESCSPPPPPPPDSIPETYVVQVPRDQVYWTPPSENAKIVERRMNSEPREKNKRFCSKRLIWFLVAIFVIGFIICAIALIIRFVFKPQPLVFDVKKLTKSRYFDIMLTSKNPTSNMWVTYKGLVSLTYKNNKKIIGQGSFQEMSQAVYESDIVILKLDRSNNTTLQPIEPVSLVLMMELSARYGTGLVKRHKEVTVSCDVKVKGLLDAMDVEIMSHRCDSVFTK
ncbi:unnamed protein product [Cochlearia groenlandica]